MSAEIVISEWQKNSRERLRVRLYLFKGQAVIDLRAWYEFGDGTLKPGRGGLTIALRHLPALADATAKALNAARASGLLPGMTLGTNRKALGEVSAPPGATALGNPVLPPAELPAALRMRFA